MDAPKNERLVDAVAQFRPANCTPAVFDFLYAAAAAVDAYHANYTYNTAKCPPDVQAAIDYEHCGKGDVFEVGYVLGDVNRGRVLFRGLLVCQTALKLVRRNSFWTEDRIAAKTEELAKTVEIPPDEALVQHFDDPNDMARCLRALIDVTSYCRPNFVPLAPPWVHTPSTLGSLDSEKAAQWSESATAWDPVPINTDTNAAEIANTAQMFERAGVDPPQFVCGRFCNALWRADPGLPGNPNKSAHSAVADATWIMQCLFMKREALLTQRRYERLAVVWHAW